MCIYDSEKFCYCTNMNNGSSLCNAYSLSKKIVSKPSFVVGRALPDEGLEIRIYLQ